MPLTGELIIGAARVRRAETFSAIDPSVDQAMDPPFSVATAADVERACALAAAATDAFRSAPLEQRAALLDAIAANIETLGDTLLDRTERETGLPRPRLEGERARTTGQLRLFAQVVRDGAFLGVRVDNALPDRKPAPRPDLRQQKLPLGPIAVFAASNFPLAFSVAGGDTASALAAGCPVVVKAHPAHPGTSELVGAAIAAAVQACQLPEGVFSLLSGPANTLGEALVSDPRIKGVGFTGSRAGGLALMRVAQARPEPIPVYAEMSSINPVILLPAALAGRGQQIAAGFVASLTMGAGQFCTNPGVVLAIDGPDLNRFIDAAAGALSGAAPGLMLSSRIHRSFVEGVEALAANASVTTAVKGGAADAPNRARAALFSVGAPEFMAQSALSHEVFGASSLVVRCADENELAQAIESLEGQLTVTLHADPADYPAAQRLLPLIERRAGRILANAWPTGVEVCDAMVHGGPFPATSDGRSTSVGTLAIERFLRPVCYQDMPDALLPEALRAANPLRLPRLVDGKRA